MKTRTAEDRETARPRSLVHISSILKAVLDGGKLQTGMANHLAFSRWPEVVGPMLAEATKPLRVQGRTLWVYVESAVMQHHLSLLTPRILERLRQEAPGCTIDSIRFTMNPER